MNSIFDNSEEEESINVNIYKPRGLFSGLKWFARRQKNDEPPLGIKSYKFKITKKDIEKCRRAGIDLTKLENPEISSKKIFRHQGQVAVIPKNEMDCDFWKEVTTNSRAYKNRFVSRSTISVKSKLSTTKFNYIQNIKSEISTVNSCSSSKLNYKVGHRRKPNMRSVISSTQTNIFLKSVPTAILKSNTQKKLLVIDRFKPHRDDITVKRKNDQKDNVTDKSNVLPKILTKIESMEEKLCGIEEKTKKISEVVSQNNLHKTPDISEENNLGKNKNSFVKIAATHKKNTKTGQSYRKPKQYNKKKSYRKNKTTDLEDVIKTDKKHESERNNEINFKPRFDWNNKKIESLRFGSNQPVHFSNQLLNITKVNSSDVDKLIKNPLGVQVVGSMSPDIGLLYEIVKSHLPKHAVEGLLGTIENSNSALGQSSKIESENKNMSKNNKDDDTEIKSERNEVFVDESYQSNSDNCQPKSNSSVTNLNLENEINNDNSQENASTSRLKETETYSLPLDNLDLPSIKGQQEENVEVGLLAASENILKPCKSSQTLADDLETICGGGDRQSSVSKFPRPLEKQLKPTTISSSKVGNETKVVITVQCLGKKEDVELKSNLLPTPLEISKDTKTGFYYNEKLPPLQSYGPKGDFELSFGKIKSDFKKVDFEPNVEYFDVLDNLTSVSCSDSVLENTLPISIPTLGSHLFTNNKENFYKKASEEDEFSNECRGTYLNYEKRKAFDRKCLGSKQNKIDCSFEQVGPLKSASSFSNTLNEYNSLFETYVTQQESCDGFKKLSIGQENNCYGDILQIQNYKKAPFSSESLKYGNNCDIKRTSSKYMLRNCDFFCKNISTTMCSKFGKQMNVNSSELERSPDTSLIYPLTKENTDKLEIEQISKDSRKIAAPFSLALHRQPIIEELEGGLNVSGESDCPTKNEKAVVSPRVLNSKEIVTVEETEYLKTPLEKKTSKEEYNGNKEIDCHDDQELEPNCINDYKTTLDVRELLISEVEKKEVTTMTSILQIPVKTAISSTSVQTDWSLIGITPEHFNTNKTTSSVACQTEVMANQSAETPKQTEYFPKYCNCFMNNSQFSELAPSDVSLTMTQIKPIICVGRCENSPLSEVLGNNEHPNKITESSLSKILSQNEDEEETKPKKQTRANFNLGNICKEEVKPVLFQNLIKEEGQEDKSVTPEAHHEEIFNILRPQTYDNHHKCTISCFTCVSDDSVLSNGSGSSHHITKAPEPNLNSDAHTGTPRSSSKNEPSVAEGGVCGHRGLRLFRVIPNDTAKDVKDDEKSPTPKKLNCTLTSKNKKQTTDSCKPVSCYSYKENLNHVGKNVKKGCATFPSPR